VAYSQSSQSLKIQIYGMMLLFLLRIFADAEQTRGPQFGTSMLHGFNGHDPAKVPKYKYAMMVLFRSEN
jgi:hypothetical protein